MTFQRQINTQAKTRGLPEAACDKCGFMSVALSAIPEAQPVYAFSASIGAHFCGTCVEVLWLEYENAGWEARNGIERDEYLGPDPDCRECNGTGKVSDMGWDETPIRSNCRDCHTQVAL